MRILFLSYFFEPDLSAGSFRNTALFKELLNNLKDGDFIDVYTTHPNRYSSFKNSNYKFLNGDKYEIHRIDVPAHNSNFLWQAKSFYYYYYKTINSVKDKEYDIVYGSSSRLFTAFLAKRISVKINAPLFLDIRDIFVDTIKDIFKNNYLIKLPLFLFAKIIEYYTFKQANCINLVSEGFKEYFNRYHKPIYTYYSNGIDTEFINTTFSIPFSQEYPIVITYAGNIGSGQGLEKIIPKAAKLLGENYFFKIIGDGGTKRALIKAIKDNSLSNVEVLNPVNRPDLIKHYNSTTYLFLHLNDLDAFKKVLPSKLFEYGATNRPIIAGVSGYASDFIKQHLSNYILFEPTNVEDFVSKIKSHTISYELRTSFIDKYNRHKLMSGLAEEILKLSQK